MFDQDVKYLKFKTYLNTYCPHCHNSFNIEKKEEKSIVFKAKYKKQDIDLKLSPYLDVFEIETSIPINNGDALDDLICPKCNKSIINKDISCGDCGSKVGEVMISALSKLMSFYLCTKNGCEWHGLSKADERKLKLKIPRQDMPEQDQKLRVSNYQEVPYGYTSELALLEAGRCLQCKDPKCVEGCPVNIDIPSFIALIADEKFDDAAKKIKEKKQKKKSTYLITLEYLKKETPLKKIAEERGLSTGTIAGHLIRLKKDNPDEDLDFYRPDEKLIEKVAAAFKKQNEGPPSQKYIFEALSRKVSYDDINLALAFI